MCNTSNIEFAKAQLRRSDIKGRAVLEVGSRDVNGSLRPTIELLEPLSYVGVDIHPGPGVDEVCSVHDLVARFGSESVDVLVSTEVIEHVLDWRSALSQMKSVLRRGGVLIITTRSQGFPYHDYPADYWRYELYDMKSLFSDMEIDALEPDLLEPGVLMRARKPLAFSQNDLTHYSLFSMIRLSRCRTVSPLDILFYKLKNSLLRRATASVAYRVGRLLGR